MKFTHLHLHSDASLKDGLGPIVSLIAHAKELDFEALALTDHGTLANAVAFTIECERVGIKPILGVEGYLSVNGQTGHITLLADGNNGWKNLVKLNNLGHASNFKEPAFTLEQMLECSEDVVCLSGCVASPLNSLPLEEAIVVGQKIKLAFRDRFVAEVVFVGDMPTWERPLKLAEVLHLPIVVTNDVHFSEKSDADVHTILTKIKAGFAYNSTELYLKRPDEIAHQAKRLMGDKFDLSVFRKWVANAGAIAAKIRPVKLKAEQKLPKIESAHSNLTIKAIAGLADRKDGTPSTKYSERLAMELDVIEKMGYSAYFIILNDVIRQAKLDGVRIGPGRGSGAGSLVLYCLGITNLDPIEYGLSFDRFLNVGRKGMPDVDVDFDSESRDLVLNYAIKKYSAKPIATYSRYMHKSLVHELAKFFRVDAAVELAAADLGPDSKPFVTLCEAKPDFERAYDLIIGQIHHKGKHAGGVVITDAVVPVERTGSVLSVAWTEGANNELSYAGVVKFDLLGLSALTILKHLESKIKCDYDPILHPSVFRVFQIGDMAGIFQFSGSAGIRELTMRLRPESIGDLTAINALYRPGALDAGTCQHYHEYKKKPREVPALFADVLTETYGVIVYQEQLMAIVQRALSGTFVEADLARRIITKGGKKIEDPVHLKELNTLETSVIAGFISHGLSSEEAKRWWKELETHGRYSFNKSHSTCYATIAFQMAWWKWYYPTEFYAECLNTDLENSQSYIMSAVAYGIKILRPDINLAVGTWAATDEDSMMLPLSALRFLSVKVANSIVANRPEGGYESISQFMELNPKRIVRGQAREALWYMGSFAKIKGTLEDLDVGRSAAPLTPSKVMQKFLGFIIPTEAQLLSIQEYIEKGFICGIINSKKLKKSSYGPYMVYYLSPTGVFWSREAMDLEEGQIVAAMVTGKGKGKSIMRIST